MGHARALLAVDRAAQLMLAHEVVEKRLTVRDTEKRVLQHQRAQDPASVAPRSAGGRRPDPDVQRLQTRLADALAAEVSIRVGARGRGQLVIAFAGPEQFQGLLERLGLGGADQAD
jgi:ParB family chromosome partitioning protein